MKQYLTCCFAVLSICVFSAIAVPSLTLESITGTVELRKAGQDSWISARIGSQVQNNDVVRCLTASRALLTFEDGQQVYVNASSQLLVSLYDNPQRTVVSRHFTLFYGAAYFLVKSILPKTVNDIKVFTPTAVVATRGTSFSVEVPESRTSSAVRVTNGTILVRNIIRPMATFVSAGYQTSVAIGADPAGPQALLDKEIRALKSWVGEPVIAKQLALQDLQGQKTQQTLDTAFLRKTDVIVIPFANKSDYRGSWDVSHKTAQMLSNIFTSSIANIKIATADSFIADPLSAGAHYKTRYVVSGTIDNMDIIQEAKVSVSATDYQEYISGFVKIHIQIVDVQKNRMIHEADYIGTESSDNDTLQMWQNVKNLPFDLNNPQFAHCNFGRALAQALSEAGRDIITYASSSEK